MPQRRRRIYLVADFRGGRAGKILFEREGVRGYFAQGGTPWQGTAPNATNGADADDRESGKLVLDDQGGQQINVRTDGKSPTLRAEMHGNIPCVLDDKAYTLKIRSGCEGGGKGALVQEEKSATLATNNDQYLFQPVKEQHLFENHSQDTRYKGPLEVCPMLPAQLGTGGNNTPFVVEENDIIPINDKATRYAGGGKTRNCDGSGNGLGIGKPGDPSPTLTAGDKHAVCYAETLGALCARDSKGVGSQYVEEKKLVIGIFWDGSQVCNTLTANNANGSQRMPDKDNFNCVVEKYPKPEPRYIVRRLTPTECARLQGFPDTWGHPDKKETLTDAEYKFWLEVRNTHAEINGKTVKEYTKAQMLTWYNKLHTDSSEYKMWGNGIALPNALYVMQGIAEQEQKA